MQTKIKAFLVCFGVVLVAWCLAVLAQESKSGSPNDPVLTFYWTRADASLTSRDPLQRGVNYSFIGTSYFKRIGKGGKVESTDSSRTAYYYSFGNLDSSKTLMAAKKAFPAERFDYPNVFHQPYVLSDFPNDTGGTTLAIGFDSDSSSADAPTGLAVIDRQLYYPHWLYLYYPDKPGFRRFTRSYRFTLRDGFVFPDSVWEVASKNYLFTTTTYRLESRVDSLVIHR